MLIDFVEVKFIYNDGGADATKLIGADMTQQIGTFDTIIDKTFF